MSKTLDDKLNEVSTDILKMGRLVKDTVEDALKAFATGDVELAQRIIDNDTRVDDYDISIEEKCMYIQAEHQPVAGDLRFIHSVYLIVIYLERIGDIAVSIAKLVKRLYLQGKKPIKKELLDIIIEMGNVAQSTLEKAHKSFRDRDAKLALRLEEMDMAIDELQKALYRKLYSTGSKDEDYIKLVTNLSLMSRYIERIGANSINIGERVIYFLTGDFKAIHSDP
ncbi:MAG: phosphate signaling complex protein PhoU [Actinomycetota bacterium]